MTNNNEQEEEQKEQNETGQETENNEPKQTQEEAQEENEEETYCLNKSDEIFFIDPSEHFRPEYKPESEFRIYTTNEVNNFFDS